MGFLQKGAEFFPFCPCFANGQTVINCYNRIKTLHNGTGRLLVSLVGSPTTTWSVLRIEKFHARAKESRLLHSRYQGWIRITGIYRLLYRIFIRNLFTKEIFVEYLSLDVGFLCNCIFFLESKLKEIKVENCLIKKAFLKCN